MCGLFRIYPAYLVSIMIFLLVLPITRWSAGDWSSLANQIDLALHLLLAQNFLPQTLGSINGAYWSLAIEFQLYLLFPLVLFLARRIGWQQTLIVTGLVELVSRLCSVGFQYHEPALCPADGLAGLAGLACRRSAFGSVGPWVQCSRRLLWRNSRCLLPGGRLLLWLWPLLVVIFDQIPLLRVFAFPLAAWGTAQWLIYFLNQETSSQSIPALPIRALNFIGVISYSIYLLHQPIYQFIIDSPMGGGFAVKFPLAIAAFMVASYLLYLLVETPGIRAGKAVVNAMRRSAPVVE